MGERGGGINLATLWWRNIWTAWKLDIDFSSSKEWWLLFFPVITSFLLPSCSEADFTFFTVGFGIFSVNWTWFLPKIRGEKTCLWLNNDFFFFSVLFFCSDKSQGKKIGKFNSLFPNFLYCQRFYLCYNQCLANHIIQNLKI